MHHACPDSVSCDEYLDLSGKQNYVAYDTIQYKPGRDGTDPLSGMYGFGADGWMEGSRYRGVWDGMGSCTSISNSNKNSEGLNACPFPIISHFTPTHARGQETLFFSFLLQFLIFSPSFKNTYLESRPNLAHDQCPVSCGRGRGFFR